MYDGVTGTWRVAAPMLQPRSSFAASYVDGYVYAIGGIGGDHVEQQLASVERYSVARDEWTAVAPMLRPRAMHAMCVCNGHIYAIGGRDTASAERYDPATDAWTPLPDMNFLRRSVCACAVDNTIYAIGGWGAMYYDDYKGELSEVEAYDIVTNKWTGLADDDDNDNDDDNDIDDDVADLPVAFCNAAAACVDGRVYVLGGYSGGPMLASTLRYDAAANTWTKLADMTMPRDECHAAVVGGKLTVFGGRMHRRSVEQYDSTLDKWSVVDKFTMPTVRWRRAFCVAD
jgi:N-acetylneuraminic acid mutarotase